MREVCANCNTPLEGKYCHACGQLGQPGKINLGDTFRDFLSSAFSFEGPFFNTLKGLVVHPGRVYREFFAGKRKSYYKPVSLFILLTAIYIIIRTVTQFDPLEGSVGVDNVGTQEQNEIAEASISYMVKNINYIMFFLVFSIAFMLKLFFWRKYNLAEYLVVGLYITSLYVILVILVMLVKLTTGFYAAELQLPILMVLIFINAIALFRNYGFFGIVRYILVGVLSVFFYMMFGFGFSFAVTFITMN